MISGLTGSPAALTSRSDDLPFPQIMLDQHPPDGRRGAERRDLMLDQRVERRARLEALAERDHGRAGVPGREHARPGVLGPAGRGNVEMRVAGLEAEPVHGREVPDRVARVGVHDELGARGRAGGEIEQHRVVGIGRAVGLEELAAEKHGVTAPARRGDADRDAHDALPKPGEFLRIRPVRDQKFRMAPLQPVGDVGWPKRRHRRDQHEAELHRSQHRRPQFGDHAEHHQKAVATPGAERAQAIGETRRFDAQILEGPRLDAIADDLQCGLAPMLSGRELGVEPVERPVEPLRPRPDERGPRAVIVVPKLEQEVARLAEGGGLFGGAGRG